MLRSRTRKRSGTVGGTIIVLVLGFYASGWPEHVRAHPYALSVLLLVGIGALIFGLWPAERQEMPIQKQSNSAGRDNTGQQIIAPGSTFHIGVDRESGPKALVPQVVVEQTKPRLPVLELRRERARIVYRSTPGKWVIGNAGESGVKDGVLLWVSNPPAIKGQLSRSARDLVVHVSFKHSDGTTQIARAYWLDEIGNNLDIESGHEFAILVGYFDDLKGVFCSHENKQRSLDGMTYFGPITRQKGQERFIPIDRTFFMHVSIINDRTKETVEQTTLVMKMPERMLGMDSA